MASNSTEENEYIPTFSIKKISLVSTFCHDQQNETCAICRNANTEPSVTFASTSSTHEKDKNGLIIAFGACSHSYHLDCINRWIKKRNTCAICNRDWDMIRTETLPAFFDS
jgi:RING-box protein 1